MSDCEHLNHPEHWPGDAGDIAASLAHTTYPMNTALTAIRQIAQQYAEITALPTYADGGTQ